MKPEATQIACLVNMEEPQSVLEEVKAVVSMMMPDYDFEPVNHAFSDVVNLFHGQYPGYRKCNTRSESRILKETEQSFLQGVQRVNNGESVDRPIFSVIFG